MSLWSFSWKTLKNRRGSFTLGGGGAGPPGPGVGIPAAATWMAATNWANRAAPVNGGPRGPAGPTGPGTGGGGRGSGGPPPPPAPPLGGGTGAAISKTQCNNRSNLTLVVDN